MFRLVYLKSDIDKVMLVKENILNNQMAKSLILGVLSIHLNKCKILYNSESGELIIPAQDKPLLQKVNTLKARVLDTVQNCARIVTKKKYYEKKDFTLPV